MRIPAYEQLHTTCARALAPANSVLPLTPARIFCLYAQVGTCPLPPPGPAASRAATPMSASRGGWAPGRARGRAARCAQAARRREACPVRARRGEVCGAVGASGKVRGGMRW
eukprot:363318-Chlamydomonas_euryale.AAC.11